MEGGGGDGGGGRWWIFLTGVVEMPPQRSGRNAHREVTENRDKELMAIPHCDKTETSIWGSGETILTEERGKIPTEEWWTL